MRRLRWGTRTVFLDANLPMYLVGGDHPNKSTATALIRVLVLSGVRLVTDAEVFQEILHRYASIGRVGAIEPAFEALFELVEEIYPIDFESVQDARALVLSHPNLSARDAIHIAVMKFHGVDRILSFDAGFDRIPGVHRLSEL